MVKRNREYWRKRIEEEALLDQYLADLLEDDDKAGLEEHLVECEQSRRELEQMRLMDQTLHASLSPERSAPGLAERISYYVRKEAVGRTSTLWLQLKMPAQIAAIVLLFLGLGFILDTQGGHLSSADRKYSPMRSMGSDPKVTNERFRSHTAAADEMHYDNREKAGRPSNSPEKQAHKNIETGKAGEDGRLRLFSSRDYADAWLASESGIVPGGIISGIGDGQFGSYGYADFNSPSGDGFLGSFAPSGILNDRGRSGRKEFNKWGDVSKKDYLYGGKLGKKQEGRYPATDPYAPTDASTPSPSPDDGKYYERDSGASKSNEYLQGRMRWHRDNEPGETEGDRHAALPDMALLRIKNNVRLKYNLDKLEEYKKDREKDEEVAQNKPKADKTPRLQPKDPDESPKKVDPRVKNIKLIRNATAEFEVENYNSTLDRIRTIVQEENGFISSESSSRGANGKVQGVIVLRVVPENFDRLIMKLRGIGELKSRSINTQDVTKHYFDIASRIRNLKVMEKRLLNIIATRKGKIEELLKVEVELSKKREEIERLQGQIKYLDSVIGLSTIRLTLIETGISDPALYVNKQSATLTSAAKDVAKAFKQAKEAAKEFKARVLISSLNEDPKQENAYATLQFETKAEQFLPLLEKLRTLGVEVKLDVQSEDRPEGGRPGRDVDGAKREQGPGRITMNLIQLNSYYKESAAVTSMAPDVAKAFQDVQALVVELKGRILAANLQDHADKSQITATLEFEVPSEKYPTAIARLRTMVKVVDLQQGGPAFRGGQARPLNDIPGNTFAVINMTLSKLRPIYVHTSQMSVEAADVEAAYEKVKKWVADAKAKTTGADLQREGKKVKLARLAFEMKYSEFGALVTNFKGLGRVIDLQIQALNAEADLRDQETPGPNADRVANISLNLQLAKPVIVKLAKLEVRVSDVEAAFRNAKGIAADPDVKVRSSNLDSAKAKSRKGILIIEAPANQFDALLARFTGLGTKIDSQVREPDLPDEETPGIEQLATIKLTLTDEEPAFSDKGGAAGFMKTSMKNSFEFFIGSVGFIMLGVGFVLPWLAALLLIIVAAKVIKKYREAPASSAKE